MLQETDKDQELQLLQKAISTGLPQKESKIPKFLHSNWNFKDQLTIEKGILMKNSKILIREILKQKFLKQIHAGHHGTEVCRKKAREFVFWVNINKDIEELVQTCRICQSQDKVISIIQKYVSEVPPHPWHTLGSDLLYFRKTQTKDFDLANLD